MQQENTVQTKKTQGEIDFENLQKFHRSHGIFFQSSETGQQGGVVLPGMRLPEIITAERLEPGNDLVELITWRPLQPYELKHYRKKKKFKTSGGRL